jgi:hypothetical protein
MLPRNWAYGGNTAEAYNLVESERFNIAERC